MSTSYPGEQREMQARHLVAKIARANAIAPDTLTSPSRAALTVRVRFECYLRLSEMGFSSPEIGWIMERDHSTVLHGLARARGAA